MDYEYWLRLASGGATFAYVPLTLASSRLHPVTKTLTAGRRIHTELNDMLKRYVTKIPDGWILTETHAALAEERHEQFRDPLDFALAVTRTSWQISLEQNRSISPWLVRSTIKTLTAGVVKTALGMPPVPPTT
jgi:hypothetical protein